MYINFECILPKKLGRPRDSPIHMIQFVNIFLYSRSKIESLSELEERLLTVPQSEACDDIRLLVGMCGTMLQRLLSSNPTDPHSQPSPEELQAGASEEGEFLEEGPGTKPDVKPEHFSDSSGQITNQECVDEAVQRPPENSGQEGESAVLRITPSKTVENVVTDDEDKVLSLKIRRSPEGFKPCSPASSGDKRKSPLSSSDHHRSGNYLKISVSFFAKRETLDFIDP